MDKDLHHIVEKGVKEICKQVEEACKQRRNIDNLKSQDPSQNFTQVKGFKHHTSKKS